MYFEIVGEITGVEVIAIGGNIGDLMRLRRQFGLGRWRKLKGIARVRGEEAGKRRGEEAGSHLELGISDRVLI
jgi:hypothetical protein